MNSLRRYYRTCSYAAMFCLGAEAANLALRLARREPCGFSLLRLALGVVFSMATLTPEFEPTATDEAKS